MKTTQSSGHLGAAPQRCGSALRALAAVAVCASVRCGGDDGAFEAIAQAIEGIYELTANTKNTTGCDTEGPSTLESRSQRFVLLTRSDFLGVPLVSLYACSSADDCRAKAATFRSTQTIVASYSYNFTVALNEQTLFDSGVGTGSAGTGLTCTGGFESENTLVRQTDGGFRLESRVTLSDDYPAEPSSTGSGFAACTTDGARAAAEGNPCGTFEVFTARFVEAL
jgi:hypothetical protein